MRNKILHAVVAVCTFMFLMTSGMDAFAAKTAPSSQVKAIQTALNKDGYKVAVDGKMGKQTHAALMKFQKANGLPATGKADAATMKKLGVK
jgi:peptidoglycan hydrolase-like protein with peptidoglycan-binding domain